MNALRRQPIARLVGVVDDDPHALHRLLVALTAAGLQVQAFSSVAALLLALDEGTRLDLVISGPDMPGWDANQLLRALERRDPRLRVLLVSDEGEREADPNLSTPGGVCAEALRLLEGRVADTSRAASAPTVRPEPPKEVGLLAGYTLTAELGRGDGGVVYAATDEAGARRAIKLLDPSLAQDTRLLHRYLHEVDRLRTLRPPHVVRYLAAGVSAGRPYLVMERVHGYTASEQLSEWGKFSVADALSIGARVATALRTLSAAGLTHRDIRPANIMLDLSGRVTLIDFGLPSAPASDDARSFLAPELVCGHREAWVGSDLYALGATLYQLLSGHPPHAAGEPDVSLLAEAEEPLGLLGLPPVFSRLLARLLHPRPERRLTDPGAAAARLTLAATAAGRLARPGS